MKGTENMEKIKKHKKLTAVLAVIAAVITALAMMLPSYATSGTELIKEASEAGSAKEGSRIYPNANDHHNYYSSWGLPDSRAYEVPKEYASRLTSIYHPKADYPATEVEASGNVKSKVKMVWYAESKTENPEDAGKTYSLDPDDGPIFKLSDSKPGKGVSLTYRNLYVYDPDDAGSLKKEKYGYVPVDLTVTVTGYSEKVYDAGKNPAKVKSYTDDPLIQFSNKVRGLPSIELYNVGAANVKYTYTYGADSSKAGQSYTIKTNMTYSDIDAGQVIAMHNNKASYYVASDTGLNYVETNDTGGKYSAFYGNTPRNISSTNYDEEEKYSFGQTYETDVQRIKYVATSARNNQLTGTPTGAHTHFAASSYNMYKVVAPDPSKFVNDSDDTTATWDGSKVNWGSSEDVNTNVNGIGSPKTSWTYSIEQNMPAGVPKQWRYKSIQFDDQVSRLLKIKDVKVMCDNTNATGWFDISVSDDNHVTAKLKDTADEAQLSKIYRTDQEASLSLKITVALDRSLTMQDFRGANALVADERGEEGAIHIENKASTTIDKRSKDGTSPNTVETKKTDHNVIRFFDDEPFEYDVYQKVKDDQIHFDHFYIKDIMDPCIHEESSQGQIRVYDENENDVTDKFNVTVDEDTVGENRGLKYYTVKATAKDDVLKDESFYGHT